MLRFLVVFAIVVAIAYAGLHFQRSYQYSWRHDELKTAAGQAIASLKECQRLYTVELKFSEANTKTKCQEADNIATTALKALHEYETAKK